uniref:Uncharacterized protein n=1 Tax=Lepeophtheirus salmonis TaxID=72036 RepID=A0A0K2TJX7_LEPSM
MSLFGWRGIRSSLK